MPGFLAFLPAIAAIGSAVIGGLSSRSASKTQAKAAKESGQMQLQAARESIAEQKRQFDIAQQNMQPWLQAGQRALGGMERALYGPEKSKYAKFTGTRRPPTPPSVPGFQSQANLGGRRPGPGGPSIGRRNFGTGLSAMSRRR